VTPSGGLLDLGPVYLTPVSVDLPESVSGVVVANDTGVPISAAFVSLDEGTATVVSGVTGSDGTFDLPVLWGTYDLSASAPGYFGSRLPLIVHTNVTGVRVVLPLATYLVSGTIRDSSTGYPLDGATVSSNGAVVSNTSASGGYRVVLPNGSYDLIASDGASAISYAPLPFTVTIAGRGLVRNLSLTETLAQVEGVVVDADSGLPLPLARVSVEGSPIGAAETVGVSSTGEFFLSLSVGSYTLNVSAPGYESAGVALTVPTGSGPVTIALTPLVLGGGSSGVPLWAFTVAAAVAVVVVALVVIYERRRPPPPPGPPRWTLDDEDTR
jgi:hypothetical protein